MQAWQLFIRHAHRDTEDRLEDNGLSEKGIRQGRELQKRLEEDEANRKPKRIWSSPKIRCIETAEFVAAWAGIKSGKIEIREELDEQGAKEGVAAFKKRIERLYKEVISSSQTCFVSHGHVLPMLAQLAGFPNVDLKKGDFFWLVEGELVRPSKAYSSGNKR